MSRIEALLANRSLPAGACCYPWWYLFMVGIKLSGLKWFEIFTSVESSKYSPQRDRPVSRQERALGVHLRQITGHPGHLKILRFTSVLSVGIRIVAENVLVRRRPSISFKVRLTLQSRRPRMAHMADTDSFKEFLAIACFASFSSILGALLAIFIYPPSIYVSRPWLYAILKSSLAGALTIATFVDSSDSGCQVIDSWASVLGGAITAGLSAGVTIDLGPPSGPEHATLMEDELHELRKRECDSPRARERDLWGGILTAVVIGLRNLAYGVWFFSFENISGRWMLQSSGTLLRFLAPQFVTLGAAVAVPMYFGTKCRWRTLLAVEVSSAAYPLGYIVVAFALPSAEVVCRLLEFAAGMISALTLMYMFTSSLQYAPWRHCMVAFVVGLACMAGIR